MAGQMCRRKSGIVELWELEPGMFYGFGIDWFLCESSSSLLPVNFSQESVNRAIYNSSIGSIHYTAISHH
jgi:hypothetical protein